MTNRARQRKTYRIRSLLYVAIIAVTLFMSGCGGPFMIVLGCPFSVDGWRTRCRYFSATRFNTGLMQNAWRSDEEPVAAKIAFTGLLSADLVTSLTFDALVDTPLKLTRGSCEPPWEKVEKIELVEMKDVEIAEAMQRAMAKEAEAVREKRARITKAEAEEEASERLNTAASKFENHPAALELRRMQTIAEVGVEHNTTTIMLLPSQFVDMAQGISKIADDTG